jgi:hypothetical protein
MQGGLIVTNKEKIIGDISQLNDKDFARLFCRITNCNICPVTPINTECRKRLMIWLKQEHKGK